MNVLAIAIGVIASGFGLMGVLRPSRLQSIVAAVWRAPWGPYTVGSLRVAVGVILLVVAPESRFPTALGVIAVLAIIGGLAVPAIGRERARRFVDWWRGQHDTFVRAWAVAAAAFGAFIVYACW